MARLKRKRKKDLFKINQRILHRNTLLHAKMKDSPTKFIFHTSLINHPDKEF